MGENQNIELTYDLSEGDYIYITLYPQEGERGIRKEFQVPLMNLDSDFLPVPDSDWSADIQMVSDDFSKLISRKSKIQVININNQKELKNYIKKNILEDEMIICMGAGSISNWIREIGDELK